ncbi:YihY family inner membrane protein [Niveibacterium terrae]|uniref:YihY family inner membrane protein n=1 Tax=Niveibacterium terrae TaxID=3373598 RepID=UPI003A8E0F67
MTRHDIQRFARLVFERFVAVRAMTVAGSLAFTTLLSFVPLLVVALTVIGQMPVFARLGRTLRAFLLENLLPDRAGKVIASYALQFSDKAVDLTLVGSLALTATAVLLLLTIDRVFNAIWMVKRPRPLWTRLAIYWMALTLGPLILAASIAATTFLVSASLGAVDEPLWLRHSAFKLLPPLLFTLFFAFLYRAVPNRRIRRAHALIGGLIAALGLVLLQRLLGIYFARFPSYTLLYGAFSVMPIFLVWLYSSWLVVLGGAIVAAVIPDFLAERRLLPGTVAGRFYAALRLADALIEAQREQRVPALVELARISRQRIEETEAMLEAMRASGWVTETDAGDWVMVGAPASLTGGRLFSRFVLPFEELERLSRDEDACGRDELQRMLARLRQALAEPAQIG